MGGLTRPMPLGFEVCVYGARLWLGLTNVSEIFVSNVEATTKPQGTWLSPRVERDPGWQWNESIAIGDIFYVDEPGTRSQGRHPCRL